jgi:cellulose synthase/poly-beta-1,6-N-acetylglucosamine synthase-like glycosyltransferase
MTRQIVALVPAHNEEACIAETLTSLDAQTRKLDRIIVITDNCTDRTAEIARASGAEVIASVGNTDKKAGALNQVLDVVLPTLADDDGVLVMDADTTLSPDFIEGSVAHLSEQTGGVSGIFTARPTRSVIGSLQAMEYHRYRRQINRRGQRAYVASGTGTVFRAGSLSAVREARGNELPDGDSVYETASLTEDNELTLALLTLGLDCPAPGVQCTTDVMETPTTLFHQRHRWYLGALRNLRTYGLKLPSHMRFVYWRQQIGLLVSLFAFLAYLAMISLGFALGLHPHFTLLWSIPLMILSVERTVTVWRMGWKARLLAANVVIEQVYTLFLMFIYANALKAFVLGRQGRWQPT